MRTDLSVEFLEELEKPGRSPYQLAVFKFSSGDVYLSDRVFEASPGINSEALIDNWGELSAAADTSESISGGGFPVSVLTLQILNYGPDWFSSRLFTEDLENVEVDIWQYFGGGYLAGRVLIDTFIVQDNIEYSQSNLILSLDLVSRTMESNPYLGTLDQITNDFDGVVVGQSADVPGELYGINPLAALKIEGITDDITTIITDESSLSVLGFPSAGVILIDYEAIEYTSISGGTFFGCTRGFEAGTTYSAAFPHTGTVSLRGHEYLYSFGVGPLEFMGPVKLGGSVYVGLHTIYKDLNPVLVGFPDSPPFLESEGDEVSKDKDAGFSNLAGQDWGYQATMDDCDIYAYECRYYTSAALGDVLGSGGITFNVPVLPIGTVDFVNNLSSRLSLKSELKNYSESTATNKIVFSKWWLPDYLPNDSSYIETYYAVFDYLPGPQSISFSFVYSASVNCSLSNQAAGRILCGGFAIKYQPKIKVMPEAPSCLIGENTGSANPSDLILSILGAWGYSDIIDSTSFASAHDWYNLNNYLFTGFIPGDFRMNQVIKDMLHQCRSYLTLASGRISLKIKKNINDVPAVEFFASETSLDVASKTIKIKKQRFEDTLNKVIVRYNKGSTQGDYQDAFFLIDDPSTEAYGKQESTLDFYLISDTIMAQNVAQFWLDDRKKPYTIITFTAYLKAFPIEIGDSVQLKTRFSKLGVFRGTVVNTSRIFGSWKTQKINTIEITLVGYPSTPTSFEITDQLVVSEAVIQSGFGVGGFGEGGFGE